MIYDSHTGFPALPTFRPCGRLGSFEGGGGSSQPSDRELASMLFPEKSRKLEKKGYYNAAGAYTKKPTAQNAAYYSGGGGNSGPAASMSSGIGDAAKKPKKKTLL